MSDKNLAMNVIQIMVKSEYKASYLVFLNGSFHEHHTSESSKVKGVQKKTCEMFF